MFLNLFIVKLAKHLSKNYTKIYDGMLNEKCVLGKKYEPEYERTSISISITFLLSVEWTDAQLSMRNCVIFIGVMK